MADGKVFKYWETKEYRREYNKKYREQNKETLAAKKKIYQKQYRKDNHEELLKKNKEYYQKNKERCLKNSKERSIKHRIEAFKKISIFRKRKTICCWRCGENRFNLLTLAHLNDDGAYERMEKTTDKIIIDILNGDRKLDDLEIECFSCNWCKGRFKLYPDELPKENTGIIC
jgi:hypothetical protein